MKHPFFQMVLLTISFSVVSLFTVFYALGYQINWASKSIKQTGIIILGSDIPNLDVTIRQNGKYLGNKFPIHENRVFPNAYDISVSKPGYQTWEQIVTLDPNTVLNFSHIILIQTNLKSKIIDPHTFMDTPNTSGLHLKSNDELWLKNTFILRTSKILQNAVWFPDNNHFVYQAGKTLWFANLDARVIQKITTLPDSQKVQLSFQENGRILLYLQSGIIRQIQLYQIF